MTSVELTDIADLIKSVERIATMQEQATLDIAMLHKVLWTGTNGNQPLSQRITTIEQAQEVVQHTLGRIFKQLDSQDATQTGRKWDVSKIWFTAIISLSTAILVVMLREIFKNGT